MFTTREMQDKILSLKKEKDVCILAHAYQSHDILEIADFVGDSFALSRKAQTAPQKTLLMCGVRFMAETAKILSPEKKVILSHPEAGCPMAEQLTVEELKALKQTYKDAAVVAYINSTSALKTECDICVTSASALDIVKNLPQKEVLFIPDCNLGSWIEKQVPEKTFHFIKGGCPVHMQITAEDVKEARRRHPEALVLVHPECKAEVTELADYAGSTTGIMNFAAQSDAKEFIIGTDTTIAEHLRFTHPEKRFYPLSKKCVCHDMRLTTLMEVYQCLNGTAGEEIVLTDEVRLNAQKSIDRMLGK